MGASDWVWGQRRRRGFCDEILSAPSQWPFPTAAILTLSFPTGPPGLAPLFPKVV